MADEQEARITSKLPLVAEPIPSAPVRRLGEGPIFEGSGSHDWVCGSCGTLIVSGLNPGSGAEGIVVECHCGAFNQVEIHG